MKAFGVLILAIRISLIAMPRSGKQKIQSLSLLLSSEKQKCLTNGLMAFGSIFNFLPA
jgi:hypothetical protein